MKEKSPSQEGYHIFPDVARNQTDCAGSYTCIRQGDVAMRRAINPMDARK